MADSIEEMSFQNVVDTILKPQGIKVGGYPDELFIDLSEKDRERWQCNICYLVMRDPQQCNNQHKFCATCVFAWSMTYGANSDKCPVCRCLQQEYAQDPKLNTEICSKWVKCSEVGCALRCTLRDFLQHSHGIKLLGACSKDTLDKMRQTRRPAPIASALSNPGVMFLPALTRGGGVQGSVREGRNLLQDMMLVLHLEMELRRRAIDRYSPSSGPRGHMTTNQLERDRHMTEVLAIQEQMQEITGFLNILFSIPPNQQAQHGRLGMAHFPGTRHDDDSSSDSGDSQSSDDSSAGVDSLYRRSERSRVRQQEQRQQQVATVVTGNRNTSGPGVSSEAVSSLSRPVSRTTRRSEIRQEFRQNTGEGGATTEQVRPHLSSSTPTSHATVSRANRIDINNRPAATTNINTANQTPAATSGHVANSVRIATVNGDSDEPSRVTQNVGTVTEQVVALAGPQASDNSGEQSAGLMPRPSSTFQSALSQLPAISTSSRSGQAEQEISTRTDDGITATSRSPAQANTSASPRPGATPAPHRRPAPPTGSGRPVNTTRVRRRLNPSNNTQPDPTTNPPTQSRPVRPPANGESTAASDPPARRAPNSLLPGRRNLQTSGSRLPATSGGLLRARRRSEIQQQIHRDISQDDGT